MSVPRPTGTPRAGPSRPAQGVPVGDGMQPAPRTQADGPRARSVGRPGGSGLGPGGGIGADELGSRAPWSAGRGLRRRVGGEAAAGPHADPAANQLAGQGLAQLDGSRARVATEARPRGVRRHWKRPVQPRAELLAGHPRDMLARRQPARPQQSGPPGAAAGQGHPPGSGPAGADQLARGMARGMRRGAARRTGCGSTARPNTRSDRLPRCLGRHRRGRDQPLQLLPVDGPGGAGIVETAPATLTARHETELRRRFDGRCGQDRIEPFAPNRASRRHPNSISTG